MGEYFCTKYDNKELTFSPDVQVKLKVEAEMPFMSKSVAQNGKSFS